MLKETKFPQAIYDTTRENTAEDDAEKELLLSILNDSNQMIQVSDLETHRMLYANYPARYYTGHADKPYAGEFCYKYMMGLDSPCPFCPLHQMEDSMECEEGEVDNGQEVYKVKTKIIDWKGRKAFIEYAWDITELRKSQQIFESQVHTLIQSIPDAQGVFHLDLTADLCLSINGKSKCVEDMQEKTTVDEMVRTVASYVPDEKGKKRFFETFNRKELLNSYQNGKVEINKETDSYFDDGSIRRARITARLLMNPMTNHLECIIYGLDITQEQRQRYQYEAKMREQYEIVTALSRDYLNVFVIDAKSDKAKILKMDGYVTPGLDKTKDIEYPYYAVCLKYISTRVHPDDAEMMRNAMKIESVLNALSEKDEYTSSYRTLIDGEVHYYQFKYMRLEDGEHIIAGFQNIDVIIVKEKVTQRTLARALETAQYSNKAKTAFLNSVSHDIRTPLNAIIGYANIAALRLNGHDELRPYLEKISTAGDHLLSLINDVLDMSYIESGKARLRANPVHLMQLIKDVEVMIRGKINQKHLDFIIDTEGITDEIIVTDKLRLSQILLNILNNAVKFTESGGKIILGVHQLGMASEGYAEYEFRIKDNGIGMSQEFAEHIFEAFSRERTSTVSGIQGMGLGMSIVKKIVELMDGTIAVSSKPGEGTEFIVTLKFPVWKEKKTPEIQAVQDTQHIGFEGKRILLVEDNELNREIALEILKEKGFILDTAEDGSVAVEKIKYAQPGQYDLVLMDIQMPKMDGYEATKQIRKLPGEYANIPIIAVTANAFEADHKKALRAGMNDHIGKPLEFPKLLKKISEIFESEK